MHEAFSGARYPQFGDEAEFLESLGFVAWNANDVVEIRAGHRCFCLGDPLLVLAMVDFSNQWVNFPPCALNRLTRNANPQR